MIDRVFIPILFLPHSALSRTAMILLLIVPMLIVVGSVLPSAKGRPYLLAALLCVVLGTCALFFSFPTSSMEGLTGNGHAVQLAPDVLDLIWKTRVIFSGLLLLYIAIVAIPCILHQQDSRLFTTILPLSFLVLYFAGTIALLSTAEAVALSKPGHLVTIPPIRVNPPLAPGINKCDRAHNQDNSRGSTLSPQISIRREGRSVVSSSAAGWVNEQKVPSPRRDKQNYATRRGPRTIALWRHGGV